MKDIEFSNWLRGYEQVFQLKKTGLSTRKKEVDHVITLREPESKSLILIPTKSEKQ